MPRDVLCAPHSGDGWATNPLSLSTGDPGGPGIAANAGAKHSEGLLASQPACVIV